MGRIAMAFPAEGSWRWGLRPRLVVGSLVLLVVSSVARLALAQSDADRATARELAKDGYGALTKQDFKTAEDSFRRADSLVHSPLLVIDHARALMGLGRYVEAQERLALVLREGVPSTAPRVWSTAIPTARQLLAEVEPKIAWLTVVVRGAPEPQVTIDEKPVPAMALGVRRAADPGERVLTVSAEGFLSQTTTVALEPGGERAVEIELVVDPDAKPTLAEEKAAKEKADAASRSKPRVDDSHSRTLTYVAFGVGGAGIAVGAVTGILALGKRSNLKDQCSGSSCPASSSKDVDSYHLYGTISGIGWGLGLAGAVTGVVLLLTSEDDKSSSMSLSVSPTQVGLSGAF
jgi:hypothetical protein